MEPLTPNTEEILPSYEAELLQQLLLISGTLDPSAEQETIPTSEDIVKSTMTTVVTDSIPFMDKEKQSIHPTNRISPVATSMHSVTRETRRRSKSHSKAPKKVQIPNPVNSTVQQALSNTPTTMIQSPLVGNVNPSLEKSHLSVVTSAISHPDSKCHLEPMQQSMPDSLLSNKHLNSTMTNAPDDLNNCFDSTLLLGKLFDQFISPTFIDVSPVGRAIRAQYYRGLTLELTLQTTSHLSIVTPELVLNNFLDILRKLTLIN